MGVSARRLSWALYLGLAAVLLGERIFADPRWLRLLLSGSGLAAVLGVAVAAVLAWVGAEGDDRRILRLLGLAFVGCAVGLLGTLAGTEDAVRWLGLDFELAADEARFRRGVWSVSSMVLALSLLPAVAAHWALRGRGGEAVGHRHVDALRVVQTAAGAFSTALAGCFLMLAGYVAAERDATLDASYFRTASPGTPVQEIVESTEAPLRVLLFFPEANLVSDEVAGYFGTLERATGNVTVEEHDRFAEPRIAEEHRVTSDGTVILAVGDRSERILVPTELDRARGRLRVLDGEVQRTLLMLTRGRRVVYLTTGHGERNDTLPVGPGSDLPPSTGVPRDSGEPPLDALRRLLGLLNYEVREIGLLAGLGSEIPEDAAAVLAIGPTRPFLEEEAAALEAYVRGGGSLLLAIDPGSGFELGGLRHLLGVDFRNSRLVDDRRHLSQRGGPGDRRLVLTDRFSTHASVRSASRRGPGAGILLVDAGHLVTDESGAGRVRSTIRTLPSTFADLNGNLRFDEGRESRGSLDVAVAVEGATEAEEAERAAGGMRALVYADADLFSDAVLTSLALNVAVVADGIRWLGREEAFAGETVSEEDVPIAHTREEDVAWFYAVIFGAPALVLTFGIAVVVSSRRSRRARA